MVGGFIKRTCNQNLKDEKSQKQDKRTLQQNLTKKQMKNMPSRLVNTESDMKYVVDQLKKNEVMETSTTSNCLERLERWIQKRHWTHPHQKLESACIL